LINYEPMLKKLVPKSSENYECLNCIYSTFRKSQYDRHLLTSKHIKSTICQQSSTKINKKSSAFDCSCGKVYKERTGLWRHKKACSIPIINETNNETNNESLSNINAIDKDDLILELLKQNKELLEIVKNGTTNNSHNTTNNTYSNNNAFNLNFFLNETCKNAMNITDFIESIKLQLTDLMDVGKLGYVEGISNIIVKNLNALDVTERPVHCTDKKRETFYVKDQGQWEKEDEERKKIKKVIKTVANKNIRLLPQYRDKFPDYNNSDSVHSDEHSKIVIESMISDSNKDEKIIKNISKAITIDKFKDG